MSIPGTASTGGAVTSGQSHTPGPWTAGLAVDGNDQPVVFGPHYEVATCWHHCVGSIEREAHANARLIAAAPDLLEALIRVVAIADRRTDEFDAARAAIAKAGAA